MEGFVEQRVETNSVTDLDLGLVREDSADLMADLPCAAARER